MFCGTCSVICFVHYVVELVDLLVVSLKSPCVWVTYTILTLFKLFLRSCTNETVGVSGTAPTPEHAAPRVGLRTAQSENGRTLHQADGATICEYRHFGQLLLPCHVHRTCRKGYGPCFHKFVLYTFRLNVIFLVAASRWVSTLYFRLVRINLYLYETLYDFSFISRSHRCTAR